MASLRIRKVWEDIRIWLRTSKSFSIERTLVGFADGFHRWVRRDLSAPLTVEDVIERSKTNGEDNGSDQGRIEHQLEILLTRLEHGKNCKSTQPLPPTPDRESQTAKPVTREIRD